MHTTPIRRSATPRPSRRAKALLALGAASLALIAAVPATATDDKPPVDKNGKKSCRLMTGTSVTYWVSHGTTITVQFGDGTTQKQWCDDGAWHGLRTSSDGGRVGGTSGTLSSASAKVLRVSPSVLRHLPITPR
jgi:hypothetical protein